MNRLVARRSFVAGSLALATGGLALAQNFPDRRLSMVVPFPAGGPADVVARTMQPLIQEAIGQIVIVENFGGVGGALGVGKVLGAEADGYTLLLTTVAEPILPPLAMKSVKYQPEQLRLVSALSTTPIALMVRSGLEVGTFQEFMNLARDASKPPLTYATPGRGTLFHLMGEHFKLLSGAQMTHIPYRGLGPAINDMLGGQVDAAFLPLAGNISKLVDSGKLRVLADCGGPADAKTHVPRLSEQPGMKDFIYDVWTGVFVDQKTPSAAVETIRQALDQSLRRPEFEAYTREAGGVARKTAMGRAEADAFYASEVKRLSSAFRAINIAAE